MGEGGGVGFYDQLKQLGHARIEGKDLCHLQRTSYDPS